MVEMVHISIFTILLSVLRGSVKPTTPHSFENTFFHVMARAQEKTPPWATGRRKRLLSFLLDDRMLTPLLVSLPLLDVPTPKPRSIVPKPSGKRDQ
jgi:hypothetical protein